MWRHEYWTADDVPALPGRVAGGGRASFRAAVARRASRERSGVDRPSGNGRVSGASPGVTSDRTQILPELRAAAEARGTFLHELRAPAGRLKPDQDGDVVLPAMRGSECRRRCVL